MKVECGTMKLMYDSEIKVLASKNMKKKIKFRVMTFTAMIIVN